MRREENLFSGLTALSAEFTIGEGELMAHDVPLGCAPDEYVISYQELVRTFPHSLNITKQQSLYKQAT
jgi:hypothetical protein